MAVRFKLDENIPKDAGALLRGAGHDVETVLDERLEGNPDAKVFATCQRENRVLITFSISPISASTLHQATTGSGSSVRIRKASRTRLPC